MNLPIPPAPAEAELIALTIVPHLVAGGAPLVIVADQAVVAAAQVLTEAAADALAVVDHQGRILGLLGLRQVTQAAAAGSLQAAVTEAMQPLGDWLAPGDCPLDALELMVVRHVEHLPVLDDEEQLVGIVCIRQLMPLLHRQFDALVMEQQRLIFGLPPEG